MTATTSTFDSLNLAEPLNQAIAELGFKHLTDIQDIALPATLAGEDIAAQGRTGTGKTAAFLITAIQHMLTNPPKKGRKGHHPRALIIAPTRELAVQIANDGKQLIKFTDLRLHAVFGGVDYEKQQKAFGDGVDILVGTPGRLIDFFRKKNYALNLTEFLIIDEADRMFDLGFIKDLRFLMRRLPHWSERQSLLFSATLSWRVMELAYEHMNNPRKIRAEEGKVSASGVEEILFHPAMDEKKPLMVHLLQKLHVQRGMVFANEKRTGESLARYIAHYGFAVGILSGDVPQRKRMSILKSFIEGELHLLVATDVASRGLHIDGVTHVFNYDLPEDAESYVHRIGRTARAGASGVAISFACERFCLGLPDIEALIAHSLPLESIEASMLDVGKVTHPDAQPEGLQKNPARRHNGDKTQSKSPRRRRPPRK